MKKITITFPDNSKKEFDTGITGMQIAEGISRGLAKNALSVTVNGEVWDLSRPIAADSSVKINTWDSPDGKSTYWHSSAHLMAEAVETLFPGTRFGIGPSIDNGFYYDIDMGDHSLTPEDLAAIEAKMREIRGTRRPFSTRRSAVGRSGRIFYEKRGPVQAGAAERVQGADHQHVPPGKLYGPLLRSSHPVDRQD